MNPHCSQKDTSLMDGWEIFFSVFSCETLCPQLVDVSFCKNRVIVPINPLVDKLMYVFHLGLKT